MRGEKIIDRLTTTGDFDTPRRSPPVAEGVGVACLWRKPEATPQEGLRRAAEPCPVPRPTLCGVASGFRHRHAGRHPAYSRWIGEDSRYSSLAPTASTRKARAAR